MNMSTVQKTGERDRRAKRRFPMEREVRYKALYNPQVAQTGTGKSLNISSKGIWFTTEDFLTTGIQVELSMDWPALLNDSCPMKLIIYGYLLPTINHAAAAAIAPHD